MLASAMEGLRRTRAGWIAAVCGLSMTAALFSGLPPAAAASVPTPQIVATAPGNGKITVTWAFPGVTTPTGLQATAIASPGGASCRTTTDSCTIMGLANGVVTTVIVSVKDQSGLTASSATSKPTFPANPTVAWQVADQAAVTAGCPADPRNRVNVLQWFTPPSETVASTATIRATIVTDLGPIVIKLVPAAVPKTVASFVFLARQHYFDCVIFHRVIPGFVDQTGDPTGTGFGGPGYTLPDEFPAKASSKNHQYALGAVAMANTGAAHSGGSQFFFVMGASGEALPPKYSLFGRITSGLSVAEAINAGGSATGNLSGAHPVVHRMLSVTISEP